MPLLNHTRIHPSYKRTVFRSIALKFYYTIAHRDGLEAGAADEYPHGCGMRYDRRYFTVCAENATRGADVS